MAAVSANGYGATRVEDIIALAGVSRRTFYDHFSNKEQAFLAAYDFVVEQLRIGVAGAYATGGTWASKVRRGLGAFLNLMAGEPELAHVCIVEAVAAGPQALDRRMSAMADFRLFLTPPAPDHPPVIVSGVTAETVVGGVYEVIYSRVVTNRTAELPRPAARAALQRPAAVRRHRGRGRRVPPCGDHGRDPGEGPDPYTVRR